MKRTGPMIQEKGNESANAVKWQQEDLHAGCITMGLWLGNEGGENMIDVELRKKEEDPKKKWSKRDGVYNTMRVVLTGEDKATEVEWTLTLKYEGEELPSQYREALGKNMHSTVKVAMKAGTHQTQLEGD